MRSIIATFKAILALIGIAFNNMEYKRDEFTIIEDMDVRIAPSKTKDN